MLTWPAIAAFCAACAGLGASVDRLLMRSSKRALYDRLTAAWYVAKGVLGSARAVAVYWLELAAEPLPNEAETKFVPFTLLSLAVGAIGIVAKLVVDLAALAGHTR